MPHSTILWMCLKTAALCYLKFQTWHPTLFQIYYNDTHHKTQSELQNTNPTTGSELQNINHAASSAVTSGKKKVFLKCERPTLNHTSEQQCINTSNTVYWKTELAKFCAVTYKKHYIYAYPNMLVLEVIQKGSVLCVTHEQQCPLQFSWSLQASIINWEWSPVSTNRLQVRNCLHKFWKRLLSSLTLSTLAALHSKAVVMTTAVTQSLHLWQSDFLRLSSSLLHIFLHHTPFC